MLLLVWIACGAISTHKLLMVWTNTNVPVTVSLSGGLMFPPQRGDVILFTNNTAKVGIGDLVNFKVRDRIVPLFHRILKVIHDSQTGKVLILTKGDDNRVDDRGLYSPGQLWLHREDILGKGIGILPGWGNLAIALCDYPILRIIWMGLIGRSIVYGGGGRPLLHGHLRPSKSSTIFYLLVFSALISGSYS